jgi:hypothetical protein
MHFQTLHEFEESSTRKLDRKIIGVCKGRKSAKKVLRDLVDLGWLERTGYGEFKLSKKGAEIASGSVGCEECGTTFGSLNQVGKKGMISCSHDKLSVSLSEFGGESN